MSYELNAKIRELSPYQPISGSYRIRLDANESFLSLPRELVERAARAGVRVRGLGEYCLQAPPRPGTLVLGFAGLPEQEAPQAVAALRRAFEQ